MKDAQCGRHDAIAGAIGDHSCINQISSSDALQVFIRELTYFTEILQFEFLDTLYILAGMLGGIHNFIAAGRMIYIDITCPGVNFTAALTNG